MRYEWFIAKRYLRPQGGATFIFHLTLISMAGVALGVASLITVMSVMNGFGNDLREKILQGQSHVIVNYPDGQGDYLQLKEALNEIENVAGILPVVDNVGMIFTREFGSGRLKPVQFIGINPDITPEVAGIRQHIIAGDLENLKRPKPSDSLTNETSKTMKIDEFVRQQQSERPQSPGIILGKELAGILFGFRENYEHLIGRRVTLAAPKFRMQSSADSLFNSVQFRIVGIFETGHYDFDSSWAYISLPSAQYLLDIGNVITSLQIWLHNYSETATDNTTGLIAQKSLELTNDGYAQTWMSNRQAFFDALKIEKRTMNYILKIIILVATFNIIATLFMVVTEKTRDIGLLRAVGAGRRNVLYIFLFLGLLVGSIGAILGVTGGFIICSFIQLFPPELPGGGSIYVLKYLPCDMEIMDFIGVALYTFLVSFLASIYPAVRASRLMPVEALRFN